MPTDETRRLLKMFGIAVTALDDAVRDRVSTEEVARLAVDARYRLKEISAFIERLEGESK